MTTEIIVFLERNTFNVPFRKPAFEHEWIEFGETARGEVVERLAPLGPKPCLATKRHIKHKSFLKNHYVLCAFLWLICYVAAASS
jgi:hypothetical protein